MFRLGWHACNKMAAANRATNTKFLFFRGLLPPNFGGCYFCTPLFFNFGPGGNALKRSMARPLLLSPFQFLTQWTGLYDFNGSFHECCVTAGHPLPPTKISNKKMAETRKCEVGLTIAPRTFTLCEILGGCRV